MQLTTALAAFFAPTLTLLARKGMAPLVRRIRRMPDGQLRRVLLYGDDLPTVAPDDSRRSRGQ